MDVGMVPIQPAIVECACLRNVMVTDGGHVNFSALHLVLTDRGATVIHTAAPVQSAVCGDALLQKPTTKPAVVAQNVSTTRASSSGAPTENVSRQRAGRTTLNARPAVIATQTAVSKCISPTRNVNLPPDGPETSSAQAPVTVEVIRA